MNNNTLYIDERNEIVSLEELRTHFTNNMEEWERNEYDNDFNNYLACCMYWNGGTLSEYTGDIYDQEEMEF